MEIKPLNYNIRGYYNKNTKKRDIILQVQYGYSSRNVTITEQQLIKFLENPFTHFHIGQIDTGLSNLVFDNLNCFTKMDIVNYLYQRIEWIDYIQLQFSAAYVYDNELEKIKFEYIKFTKEIMKMPSELKFMSSCLGSYLFTANSTTKQMTPTQISIFRSASSHFAKIRQLFAKRDLDFSKYTIGVMSNVDMNVHVAGIIFSLFEVHGVKLIAVLSDSNFDNAANPSVPKIKEVIMREENVKDKYGLTEKRERIYVKYQ